MAMNHYCKKCFENDPAELILIPGYEAFCLCKKHLSDVANDLADWQVENAIPLSEYVVVEEQGFARINGDATADFMAFNR